MKEAISRKEFEVAVELREEELRLREELEMLEETHAAEPPRAVANSGRAVPSGSAGASVGGSAGGSLGVRRRPLEASPSALRNGLRSVLTIFRVAVSRSSSGIRGSGNWTTGLLIFLASSYKAVQAGTTSTATLLRRVLATGDHTFE